MRLEKKLLLFGSVSLYFASQGIYASHQLNDSLEGDRQKHSYSLASDTGLNLGDHIKTGKPDKIKSKHDNLSKESTNALEAIEFIRQKKGTMGYPTNDVENGLSLISSFITSMEVGIKNEKDSLSKKNSFLERELASEKHRSEQLIKEKVVIEREKSDLSKKIDELQRKLEEQVALYSKADANLQSARKDLEHLTNESQRLNTDHRESQQDLKDEIKNIYSQLKEKSDLLAKNQKELNEVQYKLSSLSKEKEQLSVDLKEQSEKSRSLQASNKDLQEMYFKIEVDNTKLGQENVLLHNQLRYIQNDLKQKESFIQKGTSYVSELDKEKRRIEENSKQRGFQLETAEDKLHIYQDNIKQKDEDLNKKEEIIKSLKYEMEKKQERINILERENTFKDQIPFLRGNLMTILTILGKPSSSDNIVVLTSELMQAVILKMNTTNK